MDKLNFKTKDGIDVNLEKLSQLFPEAISETKDENGNIKRVANLDVLKTLLNGNVADPNDVECYEFTWPGKREAIMEAAKSTTKTLRPCPEESKNWDTTQNLYIEGDNLEVLKLLQESYLGKVKMIYIDPPYNTGHDSFIYNDKFEKTKEDHEIDIKLRDEDGNKQFQENTIHNPRFHSSWCSMIYSRIKLARDLLSDDGVIFISIDDNEVHNLRKICDEIFGASNFYGELIQPKGNTQNDSKSIQKNHEYILVYAKQQIPLLLTYNNAVKHEVFENTFFLWRDTGASSGADTLLERPNLGYTIYYYEGTENGSTGNANTLLERPNLGYNEFKCFYDGNKKIHAIALMDYSIDKITGNAKEEDIYIDDEYLLSLGYKKIRPPKRKGNKLGRWTWSIDTFKEYWNRNEVLIKNNKNVIKKEFISKADITIENGKSYYSKENNLPIQSILKIQNSPGTTILNGNNGLIPGLGFNNPKNPDLIRYFLESYKNKDLIILDFFSGSATTAHACMQLNAEDGGNRKFIMVQLPEICAPESEAAKAGYKNICEIGKERIRRAGEKIKAEHATTAPNLDIGFRVLKLDESNMKEVYYKPDELSQDMLSGLESNIKEDRNDLDLLYACLIDWGVELALPLKTEEINDVKVYTVNDSEIPDLIACFSENIPEVTIREIAKRKPLRVVFRDSSFADSPSKINVTEIFKTLSPNTTIKVL